jgi:hypothetical protein
MQKRDELSNPGSCWNRAEPEEWVFVLLGRDLAAPATIRAWAAERVRLGKNVAGDAQTTEALHLADYLEKEGPWQ